MFIYVVSTLYQKVQKQLTLPMLYNMALEKSSISTSSCGILIFDSFTSFSLNAGRLTFPNVPSQWAIGSRLILLENSWPVFPLNLTIHLEICSIKYGHGSLGENGMIKKLAEMQKL